MRIEAIGSLVDNGAVYRVNVMASNGVMYWVKVEALADDTVAIGGVEYEVGEFNSLDADDVLEAIEDDEAALAALYAAADRAAWYEERVEQR